MALRWSNARRLTFAVIAVIAATGTAACAGAPPGSPASPPPGEVAPANVPPTAKEPPTAAPGTEGFALFRQAGLLAQPGAIPFVGSVSYFGAASSDSTVVLVALSLANRSFLFTPENGGNRATFAVAIAVRDSAQVVGRVEDQQVIRVATFKETVRTDESVVFERYLTIRPGKYTLTVTVSDRGSTNTNSAQMPIVVPALGAGTLSSPTSVHRATPRTRRDTVPDLIANPRATLIFGRDTVAPIYLEAYALPAGSRIAITVMNPDKAPLVRDTVTLTRSQSIASAVFDLPMARVGLGRRTVLATVVGSADTLSTPLWVTVGEGIGIVSYEELLNYLRYFATPERLQALRDVAPAQRAAAWQAFWKETDPNPTTIENEALRDYFDRIRVANQQFKEQGTPGWLTDRGKVYITLGEPDQIMGQDGRGVTPSGRSQFWAYSRHGIRLEFVDQNGFGRWRLTARAESQFEQIAGQERVH